MSAQADEWDQQRWDGLVELNERRVQDEGVDPLLLSVALNDVAQECADALAAQMEEVADLAHCVDGAVEGVADYADRYPDGWTLASENVAAGQADLVAAIGVWDESTAGHRESQRHPDATHVGFGIAAMDDGTLVFVANHAAYPTADGPGDVITDPPGTEPSPTPTDDPTDDPTADPSPTPTDDPTPTESPTAGPTDDPVPTPTAAPTQTATTPAPVAPGLPGTGV